jgi:hypothetical protein
MRALVGVVALGLTTVAACGSVAPGPAAASPTGAAALNVRGIIDRGSALPCPPGEPCDPPIAAMFLDFAQPGKPAVRTRIDASGAFAVHLEPGSYSISAAPPPMNGRLQPSEVRVPKTGTLELNLVIVRPTA